MAMAATGVGVQVRPPLSAATPREIRCLPRGFGHSLGHAFQRRSWNSVVFKSHGQVAELRTGSAGVKVLAIASKGSGKQPERRQSRGVMDLLPEPVRTFPWQQVVLRLGERILDLLWTSCGWLLLPIVAVSALSEVSYAMVQSKELLIPIGLCVGSAFAGVMKETALEYSEYFQVKDVPWHLVITMLFFLLLKLPGPNYPYWARCLLPHIGNGGVWQTWLYLNKWKKERHEDAGTAAQV